MSIISVVGTSGVGKSFLVKQLASLKSCPAFFEGEEGTISEKILKQVFQSDDPLPRWKFFVGRYVQNLSKARKISDIGIDCFVDGATLSQEAILPYEDPKYRPSIIKIMNKDPSLESDKIIVLIASKSYIKKAIDSRKRTSEQNKNALKRALFIQNEYIKLAKKNKKCILIDRTNLEFTREKDLFIILKKTKIGMEKK